MWIVIAVLLFLLLLLFTWLLWARIVICINSYQHQYYFKMGGLIQVEPTKNEHQVLVSIKVPFYRFNIDPLESKAGAKPTKKRIKKKRSNSSNEGGIAMKFYLRTTLDALKTFTIRRFQLDLDTGDYVLNAQLTPLAVMLNQRTAGRWQINYLGKNNLWIEIENQLIKLVPLLFRLIRNKYL